MSIIAALLIRLKGLGKWPLAIDEYYIVKSVENILKYGIPQWESGGLYLRGLLFQYMIAGLLLFGLKAEFASRIIPVFLNLLAFPPLYILAKKISGKVLANVLLIIFCFSVWEIEFARFARMYVPFQTLFLWYLLFLYKYLIEDDNKSLKWIFSLSFISIFVYEGSVFPAALNFLILFWDKEKKKFQLDHILKDRFNYLFLGICLGILASAYIYNTWDAREISSNNLYPASYHETVPNISSSGIIHENNESSHNGFIRIPDLFFYSVSMISVWFYLMVFIIIINGFFIYKIVQHQKKNLSLLCLIALIILSALNQFSLVLIAAICFLLLEWIKIEDLKSKQFKIV